VWTYEHDIAFQTWKKALIEGPVLALPNFAKTFSIETNASGGGVGAILMLDQHSIAYISMSLGPKFQGLSTYEKEYVVVLLAAEQWRSYLQLGEFTIVTYHKSLLHLNEQRLHTPWQQKVFTKLLGLTYKVLYKKGQDNKVADALSRRHEVDATCNALSVCKPKWLDQVVQSYDTDVCAHYLISKLMMDEHVVAGFSWKDGLLRY
jgi:hypothetical protein